MKTIETGGPAFPGEWTNESDIHLTAPDGRVAPPGWTVQLPGMSMRDYFATHCGALGDEVSTVLAAELAATQGVAKPTDNKDVMAWHRFWCAVHAAHRYMMADAMLAARKPDPQQ